eukprot:bmy_16143T0
MQKQCRHALFQDKQKLSHHEWGETMDDTEAAKALQKSLNRAASDLRALRSARADSSKRIIGFEQIACFALAPCLGKENTNWHFLYKENLLDMASVRLACGLSRKIILVSRLPLTCINQIHLMPDKAHMLLLSACSCQKATESCTAKKILLIKKKEKKSSNISMFFITLVSLKEVEVEGASLTAGRRLSKQRKDSNWEKNAEAAMPI